MNIAFTMKSTSMAANSPTLGIESKVNFIVILKNVCETTHIQKIFCHKLRTEWSFMIEWKTR
jgi:hypothetical protein